MNEVDNRLTLLNSIMNCPHRDLEPVIKIHQQIENQDPLFYRQLAAWYYDNGAVRDHNEAFVITLCLSKFDGSRDVGLAMLRELAPYQVTRVVNYMVGTEQLQYDESAKVVKGKSIKWRQVKKDRNGNPVKKRVGLFINVPRSVRTEITRYLAERENDPDWFDATVLNARHDLKRLYKVLKIPHAKDGRANQILFRNNPPADSKIADLKTLANLKDPNEQAKLIIEKKIPYRVASNVVVNMTPPVLLALITVMTDQELINNMGALQKRGVFDNEDLKKVVESRLEKAKRSKKVSTFKASVAADSAGVDEGLRKQLKDVSDAQLKKSNLVINRNIGLLIDKSGSMDQAIELGKRLGSAIASAIGEGYRLEAFAFDSMPYPLKPKGKDLDSWEKALNGIRAGGSTGCGGGVMALAKCNQPVDQIVIVTDEGETDSPNFSAAYDAYCRSFGVSPSVRIIRCGTHKSDKVYNSLTKKGIDVERIDFSGDYYSLPNLLVFLNKSSRLDLLMSIMNYELPKRKPS